MIPYSNHFGSLPILNYNLKYSKQFWNWALTFFNENKSSLIFGRVKHKYFFYRKSPDRHCWVTVSLLNELVEVFITQDKLGWLEAKFDES